MTNREKTEQKENGKVTKSVRKCNSQICTRFVFHYVRNAQPFIVDWPHATADKSIYRKQYSVSG